MSTTTTGSAVPSEVDTRLLTRILDEGYGPGSWHGPDLKAALGDVSTEVAFWRPTPERHNIAELALHHAYYVRSVRLQLARSAATDAFVLEGEDWFTLTDESRLTWARILSVVGAEQQRLTDAARDLRSDLSATEALNFVLGITCHAVYHAGQIQLLKRLHAESSR
jgi:DinB family protein